MKRNLYFLFSLLFLTAFTGIANADADYQEHELYVMLQKDAASKFISIEGRVDVAKFESKFSSLYGNAVVKSINTPFFAAKNEALKRILLIVFDGSVDLESSIALLGRDPSIEYAEKVPKNYLMDSYEPNDMGNNTTNGQWYLHKIQAPEAWFISKGNRDIKVAVVDDAVDIRHPDLVNNLWTNTLEIPDNGIDDDGNGYIDDINGYDVADNDGNPGVPNNQRSHGTHVAGLVTASTDNGLGIASIGFNLSLISVKCTRDSSDVLYNTYQGIVYAVEAGADIINCSWGGSGTSIANSQVVQYAIERGCVVVASAGNDGDEARKYPAFYTGVISVGSTNSADRVSGFSTYGKWVSIFAPGSGIRSTLPSNRYGRQNGTSMSSPIVAGLLGLMKSIYPEINPESLKNCLLQTADSIEHLNDTIYAGKTGAGRINAFKAMQCIEELPKVTSVLQPAATKANLLLYPNPAHDELTVQVVNMAANTTGKLFLNDISGRTLFQYDYTQTSSITLQQGLKIKTDKFPPGIYLLSLNTNGGKVHAKVVIK